MSTPFSQAVDRIVGGGDPTIEAAALVEAMTDAEVADCLDGDTDFWPGLIDMTSGGYHAHPWPGAAVERLGVPGIRFSDGPRGVVSAPATCFPVSMARGASFDPELEREIGLAIGRELRATGSDFTGAVCVNLLRHPGWGRAQETYGEDPLHVGRFGAAFTAGLQASVIACVKHFACNSMEEARFSVDVTIDDDVLHEVYLPHFKACIDAGVGSVMSAYNALNGEWCGDSAPLLTGVLRDDWGFDGFVISDFIFGMRDVEASIRGGLDIEMPFRQQRALALPGLLAGGRVTRADLEPSVRRIVATLLRFHARWISEPPVDVIVAGPEHRALARRAAIESMVLTRNEPPAGAGIDAPPLLPVDPVAVGSIVVVGALAPVANLGDGGSSNVFPPSTVTPLDGLRARFGADRVVHVDPDDPRVATADLVVAVVGYTKDDEGEFIGDGVPEELLAMFPPAPAERVASPPPTDSSGAASDDGEDRSLAPGGDRRRLRLSEGDEAMIGAVAEVNPRTVVAMQGGSMIITAPWRDRVAAVLYTWYSGMEGGDALGAVLAGDEEPGGRLPFVEVADPHHLPDWDPDAAAVVYDRWHGQWLVDRDGHEPTTPFGGGLGYGDLDWVSVDVRDGHVRVTLRNVGDRPTKEVVQVYGSEVDRNDRPRRLLGFGVARLDPDETRTVEIAIDLSALGSWQPGAGAVVPPTGPVTIEVGPDARTVMAEARLEGAGDRPRGVA